jgi:hypothetical protein
MKKIFLKYCIIVIFAFVLVSCFGNNIYFDLEKQTICSCNKQTITSLNIHDLDNQNTYFFTLRPNKNGTNCLSIQTWSGDYFVENIFDYTVNSKNFRLKPNTEYEIYNHTFGDAAGGKLIVKTNNKGMVIYADRTSWK